VAYQTHASPAIDSIGLRSIWRGGESKVMLGTLGEKRAGKRDRVMRYEIDGAPRRRKPADVSASYRNQT
jgi:hypothetical protein